MRRSARIASSRLDDVVTDIVQKIMRLEATTLTDMLLKIRAAGILVDRSGLPPRNSPASTIGNRSYQEPYVMTPHPILLALLRDDLRRL